VKATELQPLFYGGKKKTWQMPGFLFLVKSKKSVENNGCKKFESQLGLNLLKFYNNFIKNWFYFFYRYVIIKMIIVLVHIITI
jgi:hypothetical protein